MAESKSDTIRITAHTSYLALTGELWGVYWEEFVENWPRYKGTALYIAECISINENVSYQAYLLDIAA